MDKFTIVFLIFITAGLAACKISGSLTESGNTCSKKLKPELIEGFDFSNPFEYCDEGDIINVTSMVEKHEGTLDVHDMHYVLNSGAYSDGVSRYCSFSHPIIPLGTSEVGIVFEGKAGLKDFYLSRYSCVYIGYGRGYESLGKEIRATRIEKDDRK